MITIYIVCSRNKGNRGGVHYLDATGYRRRRWKGAHKFTSKKEADAFAKLHNGFVTTFHNYDPASDSIWSALPGGGRLREKTG